MSASDKKKLRKEQNAAALTEKQLQERKEAKTLKTYTVTFIVVMVLVVAIVLGVVVRTPIAGAIDRGTHAVTVGDLELSTTDLSYYYVDAINSFYSQFSSYGNYADLYAQMMAGLTATLPLDEQKYDENTTWADYFIGKAKESAQWTYAMCQKAKAEGFKLEEEDQEFLDNFEDNMTVYAQLYGFSTLNGWLRNSYGDGANVKTYQAYYSDTMLANAYASDYYEKLEFEESDYREYEKDKYHEFSSYSYAIHQINVSSYLTFLELGTEVKGEDGKTSITYSDEDNKKALDAAKGDVEALTKDISTLEALNLAINGLDINANAKDPLKADEKEKLLYSSISNDDLKKWLSDKDRKEGDITSIEITSGTDENKKVTGYYVVLFQGCDDNIVPLANVRHILVKFTGGTKDDKTGETVYSDKEKQAAKTEAEAILKQWEEGKKTAESFAELAKKESDDSTKSNGGLIEDIAPNNQYVENFQDWCFAEGRKAGDYGIIETEYGYHVMYYVEHDKMTYRDTMIDAALTEEKYTEWEEALIKTVTVTDVNLSGMKRDFLISG